MRCHAGPRPVRARAAARRRQAPPGARHRRRRGGALRAADARPAVPPAGPRPALALPPGRDARQRPPPRPAVAARRTGRAARAGRSRRTHAPRARPLPARPGSVGRRRHPGARCARISPRPFRLLGRHDVVFGPAEDGGFWLVGVRAMRGLCRPFSRGPLVGPARPRRHAGRPAAAGLSVGFAARLEDVDDRDSYRRRVSWDGIARDQK